MTEAISLLHDSLVIRKELLGASRFGVTRETLQRFTSTKRTPSAVPLRAAKDEVKIRQTAWGTGAAPSGLLLVDETSSDVEGSAGELLAKILTAMGLSREDAPIAKVQENALSDLRHQIARNQPRVLVALGENTMRSLIGSNESLEAMRGRWFEFDGIPLLPTHHPSYLLRNGSNVEKRKVWEDMLLVMEKLGLPISGKQRNFFRAAD